MSYAEGLGLGPIGIAAAAGPSADAVFGVVQRLAAVVQDLEALRLQLAQLDGVDWNSTAAAAFRASLAEGDVAFTTARKQVETAVDRVSSYGSYLRATADATTCGDENWRGNPGIGAGWDGNLGMSRVWPRY